MCGLRVALTVESLAADKSGRVAPMLAAVDAELSRSIADRARERRAADPARSRVCMETVSHGKDCSNVCATCSFTYTGALAGL